MTRRTKRTTKLADTARLLRTIKACRAECCMALAELEITSSDYQAVLISMKALDDLTEALAGDRKLFWAEDNTIIQKSVKAQNPEPAVSRELMESRSS